MISFCFIQAKMSILKEVQRLVRYILKKKPQIEDFNSFKLQLIKDLKIDSFDDVAHRYKGD